MVSFYQWSHEWDIYIPESFPVYRGSQNEVANGIRSLHGDGCSLKRLSRGRHLLCSAPCLSEKML